MDKYKYNKNIPLMTNKISIDNEKGLYFILNK